MRDAFEDATETVRDWASMFATPEELASVHRTMPGFGEVATQWFSLADRYRRTVLEHFGDPAHRQGDGMDMRDGILARLDELDAALAAARAPFDPQRQGWSRVMAAAQDLLSWLTRVVGPTSPV